MAAKSSILGLLCLFFVGLFIFPNETFSGGLCSKSIAKIRQTQLLNSWKQLAIASEDFEVAGFLNQNAGAILKMLEDYPDASTEDVLRLSVEHSNFPIQFKKLDVTKLARELDLRTEFRPLSEVGTARSGVEERRPSNHGGLDGPLLDAIQILNSVSRRDWSIDLIEGRHLVGSHEAPKGPLTRGLFVRLETDGAIRHLHQILSHLAGHSSTQFKSRPEVVLSSDKSRHPIGIFLHSEIAASKKFQELASKDEILRDFGLQIASQFYPVSYENYPGPNDKTAFKREADPSNSAADALTRAFGVDVYSSPYYYGPYYLIFENNENLNRVRELLENAAEIALDGLASQFEETNHKASGLPTLLIPRQIGDHSQFRRLIAGDPEIRDQISAMTIKGPHFVRKSINDAASGRSQQVQPISSEVIHLVSRVLNQSSGALGGRLTPPHLIEALIRKYSFVRLVSDETLSIEFTCELLKNSIGGSINHQVADEASKKIGRQIFEGLKALAETFDKPPQTIFNAAEIKTRTAEYLRTLFGVQVFRPNNSSQSHYAIFVKDSAIAKSAIVLINDVARRAKLSSIAELRSFDRPSPSSVIWIPPDIAEHPRFLELLRDPRFGRPIFMNFRKSYPEDPHGLE